MKARRQAEIIRIIAERSVETQEQLLDALRAHGFSVTQATVSRDIKELQLVKALSAAGEYRYVVSSDRRAQGDTDRLRTIFREGVTSVQSARNLVVIQTMPGLAPAAGAALDAMEISGMIGSLAGDDTVLLIMQTDEDAAAFCGEIQTMLR